ncbi:hypothetical protein CKM354_000778900 [Cercospora kikuchii]|uniref:Major facilitator superfamily transporter n=1 Tax=Cercospora kikuchii TaxID=84275 RepID=A0A9P3FJB6_9PEZI|nr:uncharacterized protein CKM354_000778900 [Cercospora kikuchii]GIZ44595.1 hypothetical protein CKM354_000778900 [Cercospora kikuchii]
MEKTDVVEHVEKSSINSPERNHFGDVKLVVDGEVVLVPTPSPDPKDPLNLPTWRKWVLLLIVSAFGCSSVVLASGLGAIFTNVVQSYPGEEARAQDLMIYPALFMGVGNFISMPFTPVIGRRPIFLISAAVLMASSIGCAYSTSLSTHIAARNIMALAAGQSEALCPTIVEEIHFLHERARKLSWFIAIQTTFVGVFFCTSTFQVAAWGWRWWYGFFAIWNGLVFLFVIVFGTEPLYKRPDEAATGEVHLSVDAQGEYHTDEEGSTIVRVTTKHGVVLDPVRYGPRTWKYDLKPWSKLGEWRDVVTFLKDVVVGCCHPLLFWLLLLNGAFLGIYVFQATTFAPILIPPPYHIPFTSLGYIQGAQVFVCLIALPILGYGSDALVKWMSRRNNGLFKPEYRLPTLAIPAIAGVASAIIFGYAAASPAQWHWSAIAVPFNGVYFAFLGANIVGLTYAADSFPLKTASNFVVICAGRGFIAFGLSYAVIPSVQSLGYDGTMNIEAGMAAGLSALGIGAYFCGPALRRLGERYFGLGASRGHPSTSGV